MCKRASRSPCSRSLGSLHGAGFHAASECAGPPRPRAGDPRLVGGARHVRAVARAEPRQPALELHRRPDHREQPDGRPPRLGPRAEGRLPALQGAAGLRPPLPERLRLPGPLGRGRGREVARPQLQARDRGVRARRVRGPLPRARGRVRGRDRRAVEAPRHVDGLGRLLPHVLRHEHRVHLALPEGVPAPRLAVQGPPLDRVVPALRDLDLAARALRGRVQGARAPVALRALPAQGPRGRGARRLDDDAVDAPRQRRGGRQAGRRVRPQRPGRVARPRARGRRRGRSQRPRRGAGRARVRRTVRRARRAGRRRPPRDPVGRGRAGRGHGDRPHRAGRGRRGLRALARAQPARARADRRGRRLRVGLRAVRGPLRPARRPT